jgi:XTP/dITP diphosphohydrolase
MPMLLLATTNRGKIREICHLLQGIPFDVVTPTDLGIDLTVKEDKPSYGENAQLKAEAYSNASGLITMADDSGLEVDALNGEPGIRSARYAGDNSSDQNRIEYLLGKLREIPEEKRAARFVCVIAIAVPGEKTKLRKGDCQGIINFEPKGKNGFGYDPIFHFPELDKTMAELTLEQKSQVSHRGKAVKEARPLLRELAEKLQA